MCRRPACSGLAAARGVLLWSGCRTTASAAGRGLRADFAENSSAPARTGRTRTRSAAISIAPENYLSLVGLVIVILGGIAVSSVTRVFVLQKIRSIAVLKCLGATSGQIIAVYLLQVMALGTRRQPAGRRPGARWRLRRSRRAGASSTSLLADVQYGVT